MPFIHRLIKLMVDLSELLSLSQREGLLNFFGERALIAFERQYIIAIVIYNLFGNLGSRAPIASIVTIHPESASGSTAN